MPEKITFSEKVKNIKKLFQARSDREKYELILEMGKNLPQCSSLEITEKDRIEGCQSATYLKGKKESGKMHFAACSDALISAGLAALLLQIYNQETPQTIFQNPPDFLKEIDIHNLLSPLRASGLGQMYQKIYQLAKNS